MNQILLIFQIPLSLEFNTFFYNQICNTYFQTPLKFLYRFHTP